MFQIFYFNQIKKNRKTFCIVSNAPKNKYSHYHFPSVCVFVSSSAHLSTLQKLTNFIYFSLPIPTFYLSISQSIMRTRSADKKSAVKNQTPIEPPAEPKRTPSRAKQTRDVASKSTPPGILHTSKTLSSTFPMF